MPDTGRREKATPRDVTALLTALRGGERDALDELLPLVYDALRRLARRQLSREHAPRTLDATGLVHEAYLKLAGGRVDASDRAHFLAVAARAMRQVLVDHARRRHAARRGGDWVAMTLTEGIRGPDLDPAEMLALDAALEQLEPRQRQVVECRFFAGMEEHEIATALGLTERTVRRDWVKARAWLYRTLLPGATTVNDDRRRQIEDVFEAALDEAPEGRAVWLAGACAGDDDLRAAVESLLTAHDRADGALDRPVAGLAASLLVEDRRTARAPRPVSRAARARPRRHGRRLSRRAG